MQLIVHDGHQVFVEDLLLLVGHGQKALVGVVQLFLGQFVAQLFETREAAAIGNGPVDAVYKAIANLAGNSAKLVRYDIHAVTSGTGAMGEVTVQLEKGDRRALGRGASTDVIEASAKAYLDGLNRLAHSGA